MSLSIDEVNRLKHAPGVDGVLPLFHSRWSPRSFSDREVSSADIEKVFEAARWAASSFNEQPWRFLAGTRNSPAYKKIFDSLMPFNQLWAVSAPVLILGVAKTTFSHNGNPNRVALYDLGAAASYLTLQAAAIGLATHQMAGFDQDAARKTFGIPDDYLFGAVIALGYQGEPSALANEQFVAQEVAPRQRKPLKEFVFSSWGTPASI
ncbi:MAG TPA: nitroreductase family protein [Terracidiphilus sp.]|nr:nitroreductase family protein [Terracidiphilus sp.]